MSRGQGLKVLKNVRLRSTKGEILGRDHTSQNEASKKEKIEPQGLRRSKTERRIEKETHQRLAELKEIGGESNGGQYRFWKTGQGI